MKLFVVKPRGFCAGVIRAISTVNAALEKYGAPIYIKHQIVHNRHVVSELEKKGAIFVEDLTNIPTGSIVVFSAHGVTPNVREEAQKLGLKTIDATCPLVVKLHHAVLEYSKQGYHILLVGNKKHQEIKGIYEENPLSITVIESEKNITQLEFEKNQKLLFLTQTTLSLFEHKKILNILKEKFPQIESLPSSSICFATTNRQKGLMEVARQCDIFIIVGDPKSANSNRLKECAMRQNIPAYLVNNPHEIDSEWFDQKKTIGLSAGASSPENLIEKCIDKLITLGVEEIKESIRYEETLVFDLPHL